LDTLIVGWCWLAGGDYYEEYEFDELYPTWFYFLPQKMSGDPQSFSSPFTHSDSVLDPKCFSFIKFILFFMHLTNLIHSESLSWYRNGFSFTDFAAHTKEMNLESGSF